MRLRVQSPASFSGLQIWHCHELWCRSQSWLRSCIAVAVAQASSCSSNLTPNLGTSICHRCSPKKEKKKKLKSWKTRGIPWRLGGLRIWHYLCCGLACSCSAGSIPGSGISTCHRCGQKNKKLETHTSKFYTYYKATVIKTAQYGHKDKGVRKEIPEVNP